MKFSSQEDIEAPMENVFEMLCAFDYYERAAMRRGADVARVNDWRIAEVGAKWNAEFMLRGKLRKIQLEIARFDRPTALVLNMTSKGLSGVIGFDLIELSRTKTRMIVGFELRPLTLPARLLVQSLKLTKTSLTKRYKQRVADYVEEMEDRYRRSA
jgi:hypothetical protein